jgi:hypothetical protein
MTENKNRGVVFKFVSPDRKLPDAMIVTQLDSTEKGAAVAFFGSVQYAGSRCSAMKK